jgi:hypothetical protein
LTTTRKIADRRTTPAGDNGLEKLEVQYSAETFVVKNTSLAKPDHALKTGIFIPKTV